MKTRSHQQIILSITFVAFLAAVVLAGAYVATNPEIDILISGGTVVDGTGADPYVADVAIKDKKIFGVSRWRFSFSKARIQINAKGKIVAPGFIDVHTHIEGNIPDKEPFRPDNFLLQGVTTLITGNCGRSRTLLDDLFTSLEKHGTYINVASLIGHNSVRKEVMGASTDAPTVEELRRMELVVENAMRDGALGFSTGLIYLPGRFAKQDEVVALARQSAAHGGLYVSHIRDEGSEGIAALKEALLIGKKAGSATHISHMKSSGRTQWYTMKDRLLLLEQSRVEGQQVTLDAYPYDRSSTTTDVLLPDWAIESHREKLRQVVHSNELKQKLFEDILKKVSQDGWSDLTHIKLVSGKSEWIGSNLAQVPHVAPTLSQQIENLIEISIQGGAQAIYADMNEEDVKQALADPFCVFGSDSAVRNPNGEYKPHPRGSGTFAKIFRRYVRENTSLTLSQAIHKASGQAAEIFGIKNRGILVKDYYADLVIFDLGIIEDRADYEQPFAAPQGIDFVIVNGEVTVDRGSLTTGRPNGEGLKRASNTNEAISKK
jgi:N-acyl-D-amino-acid deacylase